MRQFVRLMHPRCWILLVVAGFWGCSTSPTLQNPTESETGMASYYAHKLHGEKTASGEVYDENALTAAHPKLPFGTKVRVTNLANGKGVVLVINDRGPFVDGRIIDLSYKAAQELDFIREGLARIEGTFDPMVEREVWPKLLLTYAAIPPDQHMEPFDRQFGMDGNSFLLRRSDI